MKSRFADVLVGLSLRYGLFAGQRTPVHQVEELIRRLRPKGFEGSLVRYGPASDGGYLIPDDLDDICGCISPGVSAECGFDFQLAERQIPVHLIDASVGGPTRQHRNFFFYPLFLGARTHGSFITLDDFSRKYLSSVDGDLILQMDIEGAELDVLSSVSDSLLSRFRIIVVEFHNLKHLFDPLAFTRFSLAFDRLLEFHEVVHIHPNNHRDTVRLRHIEVPRLLEFTLYRKDRSRFSDYLQYPPPHPLDVVNDPTRADFKLPACWYTR